VTLLDNERAALEEVRDKLNTASTWVTGPRASLLVDLANKVEAVLNGTVSAPATPVNPEAPATTEPAGTTAGAVPKVKAPAPPQ
jgi:hypothetical protein